MRTQCTLKLWTRSVSRDWGIDIARVTSLCARGDNVSSGHRSSDVRARV